MPVSEIEPVKVHLGSDSGRSEPLSGYRTAVGSICEFCSRYAHLLMALY